VSEIPQGWQARAFNELGSIANGQVDPKNAPYLYMVLVAPDHIESGTGRISKEMTAKELGAISGKYLVKPNDVIYSKIRPNLQKLTIASRHCLCSADMYPITAHADVVPALLKYILLSEDFTNFAVSVSVRSGMPKINRAEIAQFETLIPESLPEQHAIAEALTDADGVIAGLERLIAKKRQIKQGAMQDLLTARRRLPGFSGEWEELALGCILKVRHGRSQKDIEDPKGRFPIFATGGRIGTTDTPLFSRPSVLIGRKGTIDKPQYMDTPFWTVDTLFYTEIAEPNDAFFLYHVFQMIDWASYNEASGVPSLNAKTIEAVEVTLPQPVEQTAIATVLSDMDAELQALDARLTKARAIKEGMMQVLLTGRVRLV
jgi:type I restriction enzyme S subunit